jgi:hypothetical protein
MRSGRRPWPNRCSAPARPMRSHLATRCLPCVRATPPARALRRGRRRWSRGGAVLPAAGPPWTHLAVLLGAPRAAPAEEGPWLTLARPRHACQWVGDRSPTAASCPPTPPTKGRGRRESLASDHLQPGGGVMATQEAAGAARRASAPRGHGGHDSLATIDIIAQEDQRARGAGGGRAPVGQWALRAAPAPAKRSRCPLTAGLSRCYPRLRPSGADGRRRGATSPPCIRRSTAPGTRVRAARHHTRLAGPRTSPHLRTESG